jgi:hypothetical protein
MDIPQRVKSIPGGYGIVGTQPQKVIPAGEIVPFGLLEEVVYKGIAISRLPIFEDWQERFPEDPMNYKKMIDDCCLAYAAKMRAPFVEIRYLHNLQIEDLEKQTLEGNLWCEAQLYVWNPAVRRNS